MKKAMFFAFFMLAACAGHISEDDLRRDEIDRQKAQIEKNIEQNECQLQQPCVVN